jgi:hypothetical protein
VIDLFDVDRDCFMPGNTICSGIAP